MSPEYVSGGPMFNRFTSSLSAFVLVLGSLSAAPMAIAQDATFAPATLLLTSASGEEFEYSVGDASFYVSATEGYDDVPASVDFSLSLSTITPIDANLLEWSSQTIGKKKDATRSITIVGEADAATGSEEIRYEVTDAKVTSVSITQSTYGAPSVSLSLMAGELTINGVAIN